MKSFVHWIFELWYWNWLLIIWTLCYRINYYYEQYLELSFCLCLRWSRTWTRYYYDVRTLWSQRHEYQTCEVVFVFMVGKMCFLIKIKWFLVTYGLKTHHMYEVVFFYCSGDCPKKCSPLYGTSLHGLFENWFRMWLNSKLEINEASLYLVPNALNFVLFE